MNTVLSPQALQDLAYFVKTKPRLAMKILDLIESCGRDPFTGIGKPEPLKHSTEGLWSRRIDDEHRLVYRVFGRESGRSVEIVSCRHHYD